MNYPKILTVGLAPAMLAKTVVLKGQQCQIVPVKPTDFLKFKTAKDQILLAIITAGKENLDLIFQLSKNFPTIPLLFVPKKNQLQSLESLLDFPFCKKLLNSKAKLIGKEEMKSLKGGKRNPTSDVRVNFLGQLNLRIGNGKSLPINGRLTTDLLSWMFFHHKVKWHRDKLIGKFWEGIEPQAARNSLRVNIYNLKKYLKENLGHPIPIINEGAFYFFNPEINFQTDVDEFKHHFHIGRNDFRREKMDNAIIHFQKAMDLYKGDLLENSTECSWCVFDRENLNNQYLETMYFIAQIKIKEEKYPEAIFLFRKILEKDNLRESAHRGIMKCYMILKQRSLAIRQYMICEKILWEEYKMKVSTEILVLFDKNKGT